MTWSQELHGDHLDPSVGDQHPGVSHDEVLVLVVVLGTNDSIVGVTDGLHIAVSSVRVGARGVFSSVGGFSERRKHGLRHDNSEGLYESSSLGGEVVH